MVVQLLENVLESCWYYNKGGGGELTHFPDISKHNSDNGFTWIGIVSN